jgi:hypothetical protein
MALLGRRGVQDYLTLAFPLKSPDDAKVLGEKLPSLASQISPTLDAIGTVHYYRLVVLSDKTLLLLANFDGEFEPLFGEFAQRLGPLFDTIFAHVNNPPPTPVASNVDAFVKWMTRQNIKPCASYMAYPKGTVQDIKSRVAAAGVSGQTEQRPFLVILPISSRVGFVTLEGVLAGLNPKLNSTSDEIGTLHFAAFVPLEENKIGFFTIYDGTFDNYIMDFTKFLGPIFDVLAKFIVDPYPTPTAKNVDALIKWVAEHDLPPIGMYNAHQGLGVQDIKALLADADDASSGDRKSA